MACVRLLLQKGIPVDEKNANGVTPLHHAAYGGSHSCLTELLSQGANVNAVTADKGTPLHYGAVRGNHRCLQILLTHGANVNAQDKDGMTALHFAASEDYRYSLSLSSTALDTKLKTARSNIVCSVHADQKSIIGTVFACC